MSDNHSVERPKRKEQVKCTLCAHPASFHSGQVGHPCRALGCECKSFAPQESADPSPVRTA